MSYVLTKTVEERLKKSLASVDKGISRLQLDITPNQEGDDSLFIRVVLKDDPATQTPSRALGQRLARIAAELRRRAAADVPGFAYVDFVLESEVPRPRTKSA
jgi:hypothetical protein